MAVDGIARAIEYLENDDFDKATAEISFLMSRDGEMDKWTRKAGAIQHTASQLLIALSELKNEHNKKTRSSALTALRVALANAKRVETA